MSDPDHKRCGAVYPKGKVPHPRYFVVRDLNGRPAGAVVTSSSTECLSLSGKHSRNLSRSTLINAQVQCLRPNPIGLSASIVADEGTATIWMFGLTSRQTHSHILLALRECHWSVTTTMSSGTTPGGSTARIFSASSIVLITSPAKIGSLKNSCFRLHSRPGLGESVNSPDATRTFRYRAARTTATSRVAWAPLVRRFPVAPNATMATRSALGGGSSPALQSCACLSMNISNTLHLLRSG